MSDGWNMEVVIRTYVNRMPFCGCGDPDTLWGIAKVCLERCEDRKVGQPSLYDPIPEYELPAIGTQLMGHVLDNVGLTEHGTSVGFCWLTAPGVLILRFLRKYGTETAKWPAYADSSDGDEDWSLTDEQRQKLETFTSRDHFAASEIPEGEPHAV